jgi:hypothetical protein
VASMPPCPFSLLSSFSVSSLDARGSYPQGQLCWQPAGEKVTDKTWIVLSVGYPWHKYIREK